MMQKPIFEMYSRVSKIEEERKKKKKKKSIIPKHIAEREIIYKAVSQTDL